ncbi:ribonuclease H-like protein [Jaminaea rosea]|uniref:ribonuclease H n=1 Tax=Jaminaea rosea TaxID=1569628 RepID=A0A316ULR1_9BASI|nr:ribonuclease H-like protein [Jaminaea rosea]PWN25884.1 ribonuclease H-like protein [Jaminaea rosea]
MSWYIIYTDGACRRGKDADPRYSELQSEAAIGIFTEDHDVLERLPDTMRPHSAIKAEFYAIFRALEDAPPLRPLLLRTDSMQCVDSLNKWYHHWRLSGGFKTDGRRVADWGLIQSIMQEILQRRARSQVVRVEHVLGHSGEKGNERADLLAKLALQQPIIDDVIGWTYTYPVANKGTLQTMSNKYVVYTDGACRDNGSRTRRPEGAIGITSELGDVSERLPESMRPHINNKAELWAIYKALRAAPYHRPIELWTDSSDCVNTFTDWFWGWEDNGGRKANGQPVANWNLICDIMKVIRSRRNQTINFGHVPGHANVAGNERADRLARQALPSETTHIEYAGYAAAYY